jgi:hypothetical protein
MISAHFYRLAEAVQELLGGAEARLQIAVCWFTHAGIFHTVLDRLRNGVAVELMLEYDRQNIRAEALDFELFLQAGGRIFVRREPGLMHHKFAVVDDRLVLTGSFNWTYNTNAENLIVSDDPAVVAGFRKEFARLRQGARPVTKICPEEARPCLLYPLFENTLFDLDELRKKIVRGSRIWTVRPDRAGQTVEEIFKTGRLFFDPEGKLLHFWRRAVFWDEQLFDAFWKDQAGLAATAPGRALRCWMRRIRPGDLLVATLPPNRAVGLAVVQSEPKPGMGNGCSSFLEVQWLKDVRGRPVLLPGKVAPWPVTRYRDSGLELLQAMFGEAEKFSG